jgi:murein DD-endopeptidase MepM/ murein hydrolase activator NlpD
MKEMYEKLTIFAAVLGLLLMLQGSTQAWAAAAGGEQRMKENKQQHTKLWEKIKQLDQEKGQLADVVASIDCLIEDREQEIAGIEEQLNTATERHEQLLREQEELRDKLEQHKNDLRKRARAIYMQSDMTYLELIFKSSDFADLMDRMYFVQRVIKRDGELVSDTEQMQVELAEKKKAIEAQITDIDTIKQQLEVQLSELEDRRGEKELVIKAINDDRDLTLRRIKELEDENKRIMAQIRAMQNSAGAYKGKPWTSSFVKPCAGEITSGFGSRKHPIYGVKKMHTGIDIGAPHGTTVKAAGNGKVIYAGRKGSYGKTVMIDHGNKRVTLYAHLSRISCTQGDLVTTSTKIGEVGSTGLSTGNHLHFEVRINGEPVNPRDY